MIRKDRLAGSPAPLFVIAFARYLTKASALLSLSTGWIPLVFGFERGMLNVLRFTTFTRSSIACGFLLLGAGFILLRGETGSGTERIVVTNAISCFIAFLASLFTWWSATGSGVYFIASIAWMIVSAYNNAQQVDRDVHNKPTMKVNNVKRKLTPLSSASDLRLELTREVRRDHILKYLPITLVICANLITFWLKWMQFADISVALAIARGSAATISLNVALLPLSTLHRVWIEMSRYIPKTIRPLHVKSVWLHRILARFILIGGFLHLQGHNAYLVVRRGEIYLMQAWVTGIALTAFMLIIYAFSSAKPPRQKFDLVHATFSTIVLVVLFIHGFSSLAWSAPTLVLISAERALASKPKSKARTIIQTSFFNNSIVHIRFAESLTLRGGEFVYVNIPALSVAEWRPFSVVPEVEQPGFSIYVRVRPEPSSWTNRMVNLVHPLSTPRTVLINGPYPSPTFNYSCYSRIVLAATGVGCTPIVSVLRALRKQNNRNLTVENLTVCWVIPFKEIKSFVWMFQELVEACQWASLRSTKTNIRCHIYVTGCVPGKLEEGPATLTASPIWNSIDNLIAAVSHPIAPSVLQCASSTPRPWMLIDVWRGRPFFANVLIGERNDALRNSFQGRIGIFCCGPPEFVSAIGSAAKLASRSTFVPATPAEPSGNESKPLAIEVSTNPDAITFVQHNEIF